jgi:hypothetical protein
MGHRERKTAVTKDPIEQKKPTTEETTERAEVEKGAPVKETVTEKAMPKTAQTVQYAIMRDGTKEKIFKTDGKYIYLANTQYRKLSSEIVKIIEAKEETADGDL